jgi:transcriptional regulator with XRE-family HTH domain
MNRASTAKQEQQAGTAFCTCQSCMPGKVFPRQSDMAPAEGFRKAYPVPSIRGMDDARAGVYTSRGPRAGEDWQAVAAALNGRMAACRIGQQELSQRCGVSVSTLRAIQHGARSRRVQNKTLAAISRALGWPEDHLTRVLLATGEPPSPAEDPGQVNVILARIDQRLREMNQRLADLEQAVRRNQAAGQRRPDR